MGRLRIFPGDRFGKLTVIKRDETRADNRRYYICKCDCGNVVSVKCSHLTSGRTKSCGCYLKENPTNKTHGLSKTKIYKTWCDMRERCFNPKKERYPNYGGRGITVCPEWAGSDGFKAFYDYVSKLEHFDEEGYTLDRIDVNGNYKPGNLRWATDAEQRRNRTDNHYIEINGEQMILSDVARTAGVTKATIYKRLSLGASEDQLLRKCRVDSWLIEINGKKLTVKEIAKIAGVHKSTIMDRINAGLTGEELLKPSQPRKFLTAEERAEVKRIHKAGDSQFGVRALAKRYGVSQTQIRNILNEK